MEKNKEKLFEEFIKTTDRKVPYGIKDPLFEQWLYEQLVVTNYYEQFLRTMGLIPSRGVLEFDKGPIDSVIDYTSNNTLGICLSDSLKKHKINKKIAYLNGKIEIRNKDIMLKYNNKS